MHDNLLYRRVGEAATCILSNNNAINTDEVGMLWVLVAKILVATRIPWGDTFDVFFGIFSIVQRSAIPGQGCFFRAFLMY